MACSTFTDFFAPCIEEEPKLGKINAEIGEDRLELWQTTALPPPLPFRIQICNKYRDSISYINRKYRKIRGLPEKVIKVRAKHLPITDLKNSTDAPVDGPKAPTVKVTTVNDFTADPEDPNVPSAPEVLNVEELSYVKRPKTQYASGKKF